MRAERAEIEGRLGGAMKYRTIVADPPWPIGKTHGARTQKGPSGNWRGRWLDYASEAPYAQMTLEEIAGLSVEGVAEDDAHLYLWAINAFLPEAYDVARAWGFEPSTLLTWCKAPMGLGLGGAFTITTEFVLFARRGKLAPLRRVDSTWWQFRRPYNGNGARSHSQKPEAFLDLIEQVSPEPRLELFARRARFGWDYWGDESLGTAELPTTASQEANQKSSV